MTEHLAVRESEAHETLRNLAAWLRYWAQRTISQQSKDERGHVVNTWAACPIPDWDVKQKLDEINAVLGKTEEN